MICFSRLYQGISSVFYMSTVNKLQSFIGQGKYQAIESDSWHGDTFHNAFLQCILVTEIQLSIDCILKVHSTFLKCLFFNPMLVYSCSLPLDYDCLPVREKKSMSKLSQLNLLQYVVCR